MTNYEMLIDITCKSKQNIEYLHSSGKMDILNKCISFTEDLENWINICGKESAKELFAEAQTNCIYSIYMCAQGLYKEAIISLRQCLEHTLFAIMLSTNDYRYRLWKLGQYDMSWAQLMDDQNGVFGKQFISVYANDIDSSRNIEFLNIAKAVYRECSEFVHGNYKKLSILSNGLQYNENAFERYIDCFSSIQYVISMALFIRFRELLNVPEVLTTLESAIMDNIGMLPEVQLLYNRGEGETNG